MADHEPESHQESENDTSVLREEGLLNEVSILNDESESESASIHLSSDFGLIFEGNEDEDEDEDEDDIQDDIQDDILNERAVHRHIRRFEIQNEADEDVNFVRTDYNIDAESTRSILNSFRRRIAMHDNAEIQSPEIVLKGSLLMIRPIKLSRYNNVSISANTDACNQSNHDSLHTRYTSNWIARSFKRYYCKITMNNETFESKLCCGNVTPNTQATTGIFDVLEYYGPTNVSIQILEQSLPGLPFSIAAVKNVPLHTFVHSYSSGDDHNLNKSLDLRITTSDLLPHSVTLFMPRDTTKKSCLSTLLPTLVSECKDDDFYLTLNFSLFSLLRCIQINAVSPTSSTRDLLITEALLSPLQCSDLHVAAAYGSKEEISRILYTLTRAGFIRRSLELRDSQNRTALEVALICGNVTTMRVFLTYAGPLCFQGTQENYRCALHYAVLGGSKECLFTVMRFLLRYHNAVSLGSNLTSKLSELINWRDEREDTPGMLLCKLYTMEEFNQNKGHYSYKKNRIYEDVSTRIQSSTAASNSPTNSSISTERKYEFMKINRTMSQILRALLFFGCDVSLTNSANQTMLMMACKHGHLNLVQTLLRQRHRSHNLTAPSSSAHMTQIAQMKALPFARDIEGNSSLFYSLIEGHTAVSELLIRRQLFSLMDTNNEGNNAFHILALHSQLSSNINDIASMLIAQERKEWTSYIKDSQSVSVLINMFTRPKLLFSINVVGKRPIDIAIEKGNVKYAQLLCEAATDIYGVSLYPRLARDRQLISEIDRKPQLTPEIRPPAEQVSDPTVNPTISNTKDEIAKDTIDKEGRVLVMSEGVLEPDSCDIDCHIPPTMASSPVEVSSGDSSSPSLTPEVISIENNINDEDVVQESKVKCPSESQDDETMNIEVDVNIHAYMIRRKSRRMLRALEQAFRDPLAFLGARSSKTSQQQVPALIPQQEAQISLPSLTQLGHSIIVDESCAATNSVDLISDIDRCDDEAENDSERELAETLAYNLALQPEPRNLGYLGRFSGPLRDMYGNSGGESDPGVDVSMKDKSEVTTGVFITEPTEISINRQVIIPILSIEGEEKE